MARKNQNVTHIRAFRVDQESLDRFKMPEEDRKDTLHRILQDYKKKGVPREIVRLFEQLQHITTNYIHEDFHELLELVKVSLIRAYGEDNLERSKMARSLTNSIQLDLNKFNGELE